MNYSGKGGGFAGGVALTALVAIAIVAMFVFMQPGGQPQPQTVAAPIQLGQPQQQQPISASRYGICQSDLSNDARISVRNKENTALEYLGTSLQAESDAGTITAAGTATGGTALTYTLLSIDCDPVTPQKNKGSVYSLGSTTYAGAKIQYDLTQGNQVYQILASNATRPIFFLYHSNLTNATALLGGTKGYYVKSDAIAMTTGNTFAGIIYMESNQSSMQFGSDDGGVIFAVNLPELDAVSKNAFTLTSNTPSFPLVQVTCPEEYASFDSADLCWKAPSYKSTTGLVSLGVNVRADIGNPTIADSPVIYAEAVDYFRDTNGKVKLGTFDSGGTRQVQAYGNVTIELA